MELTDTIQRLWAEVVEDKTWISDGVVGGKRVDLYSRPAEEMKARCQHVMRISREEQEYSDNVGNATLSDTDYERLNEIRSTVDDELPWLKSWMRSLRGNLVPNPTPTEDSANVKDPLQVLQAIWALGATDWIRIRELTGADVYDIEGLEDTQYELENWALRAFGDGQLVLKFAQIKERL